MRGPWLLLAAGACVSLAAEQGCAVQEQHCSSQIAATAQPSDRCRFTVMINASNPAVVCVHNSNLMTHKGIYDLLRTGVAA